MLQLSSKYVYMSVGDDLPSSDTSSTYTIPTNQSFISFQPLHEISGGLSLLSPRQVTFNAYIGYQEKKQRVFVILSNLDIWSCHSDNRISTKPGFYLSSINTVFTSCQQTQGPQQCYVQCSVYLLFCPVLHYQQE